MQIFIKSCHASLEYDQARMFADMGYEVFGSWDLGSTQRKKIAGVTDKNSDINDHRNILLHQVEDFDLVMEKLLQEGKRVILSAFGQGCDRQHENVGRLCRDYQYAFVSSYSLKDYNLYRRLGCPQDKVQMIRFSKYPTDFKPWRGKWPVCYISCNSIHRRGDGCGWEILKDMESRGLPIVLSGSETECNSDFGLGQIEEKSMHNLFSNAMCHLHLGTIPAPITLSILESFCSGCPVVPYNNRHGLAEEGFELDFYNDADGLVNGIQRILNDAEYRNEQHLKSVRNSRHFDVTTVAPKWRTLLERLV